MSDLYEPLRERLRQHGWVPVWRGPERFWRRPVDGGVFDEGEAFKQLQRHDEATPGQADDPAS